MAKVIVKNIALSDAVEISNSIPEFEKKFTDDYYRERIEGKENLIIGGFVKKKLAGALVGYDKFEDGSFYCWMTGVMPEFRRLGVLGAMMGFLENWAKKNEYDSIKVKTRNNKREMLSYLVKNGFNFLEVEEREDISDSRVLLKKIF